MTPHRRLLVIDDSPTIRKLVEISFKRTTWTIEFSSSGSDGIAQASRSRPDLILLDFVLPDMKGTDVCAGLARDERTARIPVLILSGKGAAVRDRFRPFPQVVDVVGKPFEAADIVARANRCVSAPSAAAPPPAAAASPGSAEAFEGRLGPLPALDLLRIVAGGDAGGELALRCAGQDVRVHIRRGEVVLVTSHDPDAYTQAQPRLGAGVRADLWSRAMAEQRRSATPLPVTLAEAGAMPATELPAILHDLGKRTLHAALDARAVEFSWRPEATGPAYVDRYGRAMTLGTLALERLRREPAQVRAVNSVERVFERAKGFSRKVRGVDLLDAERRTLALVDGRATVSEIAERAALAPLDAAEILARLSAIDLVRERQGASGEAAGPVLVADPYMETFGEPLRALFAERAAPVRTVAVPEGEDLYEAIARERPRLVILNVTTLGAAAARTAEAVRASAGFGDLPLVAVLEDPADGAEVELGMLGFDAVLAKPVLFSELERLLSA
jgi:DNA-binding response OmpR family regulator